MVDGIRFNNTDNLETYVNQKKEKVKLTDCYVNREALSEEDKMEEFMFLGLRLSNGVSKEEFLQRFGQTMDSVYEAVLCKNEKDGLLINENQVRLTERGTDISNYVMAQFLL